jgi:hypothetical protein
MQTVLYLTVQGSSRCFLYRSKWAHTVQRSKWAHTVQRSEWAHTVQRSEWAQTVQRSEWAHTVQRSKWAQLYNVRSSCGKVNCTHSN